MKPRTKLEKRVAELSAKLPPLTKAQTQYAYEHCFPHLAVRRCGKWHCLDCGAEWPEGPKELIALDEEFGMECPGCGRHLKAEATRKTKWFDRSSFQMLTVAGDYEVVRTFYNRKYYHVGQEAHYWMGEAVQVFYTPEGRDVIMARPTAYNNYYCDSYVFTEPISLKDNSPHYTTSYYDPMKYYISADVVYPRARVIPLLKRNGWRKECLSFRAHDIIKSLLSNPRTETIVKAGRFDILKGMKGEDIKGLWPQVKMLIRHGYSPVDFGIWKDTVEMASDLNLDTHSPKYVLPEDLGKMHDSLMRKQREIEERREAAEARRENAQYRKEHGFLLAVVIQEHGMTMTPLQNKLEFVEEGKAMNHCVARYFNNKNCLILSVRAEGKRIATVELSMKDFSVRQCRANSNKKPERYDEILQVLDAHKPDFIKAIAEGYRKEDRA